MKYKRTFEAEGVIYELVVQDGAVKGEDLHTYSKEGFWCRWSIIAKEGKVTGDLPVTNDECEVIVFKSLDEAVTGARKFLSL